jgi:hypothetical protein
MLAITMVRYSRKSTLQTDRHQQSSGLNPPVAEKNESVVLGQGKPSCD